MTTQKGGRGQDISYSGRTRQIQDGRIDDKKEKLRDGSETKEGVEEEGNERSEVGCIGISAMTYRMMQH